MGVAEEMPVPFHAAYLHGAQIFPSFSANRLNNTALFVGDAGVGHMWLNRSTDNQILWSQCSEGCDDCARGTGHMLRIKPKIQNCMETVDGDVFMLLNGLSSQNCVVSLILYYTELAAQQARYRIIVTATGGVLLFLICVFCIVSIIRR